MKIVKLIILSLFLFPMSLQAQEDVALEQNPMRDKMKQLKIANSNYVRENIYQSLKAQQEVFDSRLNPRDRAFIQEYRAERSKQREDRMKKRKEGAKGNPTLKDENPELKTPKERVPQLNDEEVKKLRAFFERNEDLVNRTKTNLNPLYSQWLADQTQLVEKYMGKSPNSENASISLFGLKSGRKGKPRSSSEKNIPSRPENLKEKPMGIELTDKILDRLAKSLVFWDGNLPHRYLEK